ncbi:hypothetical protein PMLGA01_120046700, partial [Plasmodium malariae]
SDNYNEMDLNLEESINYLNKVLPRYIQHIHVYNYSNDVKNLFLIKCFQTRFLEHRNNVKKKNMHHKSFLYNRRVYNTKTYVCGNYIFVEFFLLKKHTNIYKSYLVVLKKIKKIEFLFILKNYNYFYVNNKSHAIFNIENVLCRLIFKNYMNALISISSYNKVSKAENILKLNSFKRSYYYFIMMYNGLLNKDIILIKNSLKILKFKETLLLCRLLFHYIWNNFNLKLIFFYFIDYFSFINHVWKGKKYKRKLQHFIREI